MSRFTITIDGLPPPELSPNTREHWAARYEAGQVAKQMAWAEARKALGHKSAPMWGKVGVEIIWYCNGIRRDYDNFLARSKPYWDGLVAAGIIIDDSNQVIDPLTLRFEKVAGTSSRSVIRVTGKGAK